MSVCPTSGCDIRATCTKGKNVCVSDLWLPKVVETAVEEGGGDGHVEQRGASWEVMKDGIPALRLLPAV
jgi:hypothetical protein